MKKTRVKIGIIGLGYVGGVVLHWFESQKDSYELFFYDKFKHIGSMEDINRSDIIFVAVPTPFVNEKGYDDSAIRKSVASIRDGKTIVIKSTIIPRSTEKLQRRHPKKIILFNPEFLRAKTALNDFIKPDRQIVGYVNERGRRAAKKLLSILPSAPYTKIMRSTEAELIKYFSNSFLATKVIFANQIYDICKSAKIDYDAVKEGASHDPRIGLSHLEIFEDGYRGYGGLCLPKDIRALIQFAKTTGSRTDFLEFIEKTNKKLNTAIRP